MTQVVIRAPGRVNLIGEHVDYCGGAVLPLALSQGVTVRATPRDDGVVTVHSDGFDGVAEFTPGDQPRWVRPLWARYAAGVAAALVDADVPVRGFDAVVSSDLPVGAGLASSAAFDVAFARAALIVSEHVALSDAGLVELCRDAEVRATGVRCGIMDPHVALCGAPGQALFLDCATRQHRLLDVAGIAIVVADSGVRHELGSTEYNRRRVECEGALAVLRDLGAAGEHLAHVPLEAVGDADLPEPLGRRARHVVTEHLRTRAAARALERRDGAAFGELLDASHDSLRDDYEVSCLEIDRLVDTARTVPGILGSRLTGGGFGGCTVTAVEPDAVDDLIAALAPLAGPAGVFRAA
jgi:galactokinase